MRDDKNEIHWDKTLRIRTSGRDDSRADQFRYPYEPTPYSVLERLVNTGLIRKGNVLLDYGCGKGRVDFFLSRQTRCRAIGIEYDERIWQKAEENRNSGSFVDKVSLFLWMSIGFISSTRSPWKSCSGCWHGFVILIMNRCVRSCCSSIIRRRSMYPV